MSNVSALFRSLLIYGLCLPLAVVLGYLLAAENPLNFTTVGAVVVVVGILMIPLLLRWHHPWLIAMWNSTAMLFFLPGRPQVWMGLAAVSLAISILQFTLNRRMTFLHAPTVTRPLLILTAVVLITAHLTGGFGFKVFGGDTYGGKRYVMILAAVMGFFAIINRQIPPKRAGLYVALFFLGATTLAIANLPGIISPAFNFVFFVFPVARLSDFTDPNSVVGQTEYVSRWFGFSQCGLAVFCAMLARYGVRELLDTAKPWRLSLFCVASLAALSGGFRSTAILLLLTFGLLFYLERLHHTRLLLPLMLVFLIGSGLLALFAPRLPLSVQRSLSFLPLKIDPLIRYDAEGSTQWRLNLWREASQEVPEYLLIGKGYSFSATEQAQLGSKTNVEARELVGDYHNGPLSVIIPLGIFGAIAFVWLMVAGLRVLYQNYQYGNPEYHHYNIFLFAYFVAKLISFCAIFGSLYSDLPMFLGLLALSISLNGGVARPVVVPQPKIVFNRFRLHPSARRPVGA